MDELIQRFTNVAENCDPESYDLYRRYFQVIGSLNADNFHLINEFHDDELLENITGTDLLDIAIEVHIFKHKISKFF